MVRIACHRADTQPLKMRIASSLNSSGDKNKNCSISLVDGISISNHMVKHRNAVPVSYRVKNVASA